MDKIIHLSTELTCSAREAFAYFTEQEQLESWLTEVAEVEPVAGGKYELFWAPDDRENDSTIGCRITTLVPNELLAFEWRSPRQFKSFANNADPLTHCVVSFIPTAFGTKVHLVHSGWRSGEDWDQARNWQERAWAYAFAALKSGQNSPT